MNFIFLILIFGIINTNKLSNQEQKEKKDYKVCILCIVKLVKDGLTMVYIIRSRKYARALKMFFTLYKDLSHLKNKCKKDEIMKYNYYTILNIINCSKVKKSQKCILK